MPKERCVSLPEGPFREPGRECPGEFDQGSNFRLIDENHHPRVPQSHRQRGRSIPVPVCLNGGEGSSGHGNLPGFTGQPDQQNVRSPVADYRYARHNYYSLGFQKALGVFDQAPVIPLNKVHPRGINAAHHPAVISQGGNIHRNPGNTNYSVGSRIHNLKNAEKECEKCVHASKSIGVSQSEKP